MFYLINSVYVPLIKQYRQVQLLDRHFLCRGLFLAMIDHVVYHGLNKELQRLTLEFLRGLGMVSNLKFEVCERALIN